MSEWWFNAVSATEAIFTANLHPLYLEISLSFSRNTIAFSRNNISRKRNNVSKECNFIARERNSISG